MRAGLAAALLLLTWAPWVRAGDDAAPESGDAPVRVFVDEVRKIDELSDDVAGEAYALLGRVKVEFSGVFSVRARRMVVWLDPDTDATVFDLVSGLGEDGSGVPLWTVRAIYAEGGKLPAVFQAAGNVLRCSSFYYDFQKYRGVFLDTSLRMRRGKDRRFQPDLVLRAKRFRATEPGVWRASDVTFFSSNYHRHNVTVHAQEVVLRDEAMKAVVGKLTRMSARDYRGGAGPEADELAAVADELAERGPRLETKKVTLKGIKARLFRIPISAWKKLTVDGADMLPMTVVFEAGSIGSLGPGIRLGGGLKTKPVGFVVAGGYIDGRGPMADAEITVDAWEGRLVGRTFGVYLHDHGDDFGIVPPTRDRYWTKSQYRYAISDVWRLDGELALLSDPLFLRVYDEGEFKEEKEQETLLYLRGRGRAGYVTVLGKVRTIDFLDTVENLPRARGDLPVLTLLRLGEDARGDPILLQLSGGVEVADLRHRQGLAGANPDFRTARFDLDPTLQAAFGLGPLRFVPFARFRFTAYQEALDGSSQGRYAGSAGLRVDTQLAKWYGRTRHAMNFTLLYEDLYSATVPSSDLFPMDPIDLVTPWEGLTLRWRNRLLRSTEHGVLEFFNFEVYGAWFPDGQRPLGLSGEWFVETDWEWLITRDVWFESRLSVDPTQGNTGSGGIWWRARSDVMLKTSYRYLEGDSDVLGFAGEFMVDTRWRLVGFSQFDIRNSQALTQGLLIQRAGKTVVVGVRVSWNPGPDDFRFSVTFDLLEAFLARRRKERDSLRREVGWK